MAKGSPQLMQDSGEPEIQMLAVGSGEADAVTELRKHKNIEIKLHLHPRSQHHLQGGRAKE